ncbi:MAG: tRNA pseudouridine(55) synthase TruB [Gemmatimonadaceae bacterium]|nr:tRNA pseudouridine(55) synthase TruB [Gemmatimonadaceae bacterium]
MTTTRPTDGLVLLDKPAGISSHDAVLAARRAAGEKRVGHAGTLDPFATGLLVCLFGRATRLLPYLPGEPKVYEATLAFGRETDTEDLLGAVVREAPLPSEAAVRAALPHFVGPLLQVPPAYSAKRIGGTRAYEAARAGVAVELAPVPIVVNALELLAWNGDGCDVRVTCGGGTYVRSLARDIARHVGSAAHLVALRRTHAGPFAVSDALPVPARGDAIAIRPALDALPHLPRVVLDAQEAARVRGGIAVRREPAGEATHAALVVGEPPVLVALAEWGDGRWHPRVVMRDGDEA